MNLETLYSTINVVPNDSYDPHLNSPNQDTSLLYAFPNGNLVAVAKIVPTGFPHSSGIDEENGSGYLYFSSNLGQTWTNLGYEYLSLIYECDDYILVASGVAGYQGYIRKITSTGQVILITGAPRFVRYGYMYGNKMIISSYQGGIAAGPPSSGEGLYLYSYNDATNSLTWLQTFEENNYQKRTWELVGVHNLSTGPFSLPQPVAFFYKTGIGESSWIYSISFDLFGNANFYIHKITIPSGDWADIKKSLEDGSVIYFFSNYHQWELPFSNVNSSEALYYRKGYKNEDERYGLVRIHDVFYDSRVERRIVAVIEDGSSYSSDFYFGELLPSLPERYLSYRVICNLNGRPFTHLKQVKFPNGNIFYCEGAVRSGSGCISIGNTDSDIDGFYNIQNNNNFFPIYYGRESVKQQIYALTSNLTVPSELTIRIGNTNKKLLKWNVQQQFIDRTITYISYNGFPRPAAFINRNGQKNLLYRAELNINKRNRLLTQDGPTMYMDS